MTDLAELYRIAEENGVEIDCFNLNKREALSVMDGSGNCYIAIDPFQLRSSIDEKDKLAHELGHCCTGSFYNEFSDFDIRQKHERRADKWAIQKLIPLSILKKAVSSGHTDSWDLAEYFNVTESFMRKALTHYQDIFSAHGKGNAE